MLGKLMKYEFKATGRIFLPLFAALIAVAAVNKVFWLMDLNVPKIIGTTLSTVLIVAICVIALILTLQRFYRNLLKSEGYLMFTLPVSTDSLIWSKLIVASIWTIASLVVVFISIALIAATGVDFRHFLESIGHFFQSIRQGGFQAVLLTVEAVILAVATLFSGILLLYVCMSLSLLVNKHRVGFSFLMYIAITTVGQIIIAILATTINYTQFCAMFEIMSDMGQIQSAFGLYFLCVAVPGAIFYLLTRYMLKNKLNLE